MYADIGTRVLARLDDAGLDKTHKEIAQEIGMTPDAFSRALGGKRAFSSIELARLSDLLEADVYWLITGELDPNRLVVAARHDFDFDSGQRSVPGKSDDEGTLNDIGLAYQQAYQGAPLPASRIPDSAVGVREALGEDFVRPFVDRLESRMDVDVVRVAGLSTSYCFSVANRRVILVAATGNWFRENWSIGHELGHFVEGHLHSHNSLDERDVHEASANAFAAELLLPADQMRELDWVNIDAEELANRIWNTGVSTDALARRLSSLEIETSALISVWAAQPTQRLLRFHWVGANADGDAITKRMDDAAVRRFPLSLQEAHLKMIANGDLGKGTLAWMLGIDPEELEVDAPQPADDLDTADLATALGF